MKLLTGFELTEIATRRFNNWVNEVVDENAQLDISAVTLEAISSFENDLLNGEDEPHYEIEGRLTWKKQPALFFLKKNEYVAEFENDNNPE